MYFSSQFDRMLYVMAALAYLKTNHLKYKDIDINQSWIDNCYQEDKDLASSLIEGCIDSDFDIDDNIKEKQDNIQNDENETDNEANEDSDDDETNCLKGLQPTSHVYTGKKIISVAPGEGNNPLSFFMDTDCETLAFPSLFPSGQFGFQSYRQVHLTLQK